MQTLLTNYLYSIPTPRERTYIQVNVQYEEYYTRSFVPHFAVIGPEGFFEATEPSVELERGMFKLLLQVYPELPYLTERYADGIMRMVRRLAPDMVPQGF